MMFKVLRSATSKNGRYAVQLLRETDGSHSVRSTADDHLTSTAVGMTEEQAHIRFNKELGWSRTDGINLIEEKVAP